MDDVYVRRCSGARRNVRLDSRQPIFTEVLMLLMNRRTFLCGLTVLRRADQVIE